MSKVKKIAIGAGIALVLALVGVIWFSANVPGCSTQIGELRGDLVGNSFIITTYDNFGQQTLRTSGKHVNLSGNKEVIFFRLIFELICQLCKFIGDEV